MGHKINVMIAGCGYVGIRLADSLQAKGHDVVGVRRNWQDHPKQKFATVDADLSTAGSIPEISGISHIVYTASAGNFTDEAYKSAYVDGLKNILDYANRHQSSLRRILFISSTGVYGKSNGEDVNEDTKVKAGQNFSSMRLLEAENLLLNSKIPSTILRFSGIYGPGRQMLLDQVIDGSARISPKEIQWTNRIHLEDCTGVLEFMLKHPTPERLYLCTDDLPTPKNEILLWIAKKLNLPAPISDSLEPSLQRVSHRGNRRVSNARLKNAGYNFRFPSYREGFADLISKLHLKSPQ